MHRNLGSYPRHMRRQALRRLFPPGIMRLPLILEKIIESCSLKDLQDNGDENFLAHLAACVALSEDMGRTEDQRFLEGVHDA